MLRSRLWAFALATTAIACGPLRPPALDPSGLADPTWSDADVAEAPHTPPAETASVGAASVTLLAARSGPVVPRVPGSVAGCRFRWVPADLRMSVLVLPKAIAGRFMVPLFDSACACTRPGDHLSIVARVRTWPGMITAVTVARTSPDTTPDPAVDACLAAVLGNTEFEGFEVPSDVVCVGPPPDPPKTRMGPPFFRFPRARGCPQEPQSTTIVYPIIVDRRDEA